MMRMNVPPSLADEITSVHRRSQLSERNADQVTKEDLWSIIDDIRNELQSHPQDPDLHHSLAVAYFARGYILSSEKEFFEALHGKPQDASIPYNLGILYYSAHAGRKAEGAWQEALRLNPSMGVAHLTLSYFYYESGLYASAWLHCQKALQLGIAVPSSLIDEIRKKAS
jgi:Tfp pilus assembly protein PilF